MNTDQTSEIDGTVIEALRPQSRRYDVAIEDGLVLSVLPNGVKTWTWVYDDPADPQRKTLGIYPAMSLEEARKSLAAEKSSERRSDDQDPEFVIRDGRIEAVTPSSSHLPVIAGAIVALFAIGVIVYLVMGGSNDNPAVDDSSPFVERSTETTIQLPTINPSLPEDTGDVLGPEDLGEVSGEVVVANTQIQPGQRPGETQPPNQSTDTPDATTTTAPDMQAAAATSRRIDPAPELLTNPEPVMPNTSPPAAAESATTPDRPTTTAAVTAEATPVTGTSTDLPIVSDTTAPATTDSRVVNDRNNVAITDTRVARGNLTSAVIQREPIDDLGSSIVGNGSDLQTYYFFTELRELAGQQVRHRWVHGDRVVAEIPFNVGEAWRWRVYSSKTFIPSMSGEWQVQVLLEDDTVIHNVPFVFVP